MDKSILNKYNNQEEKLILSKVMDKISFCEKRNQIQVTDFLDLAKQELIKKFLIKQNVNNVKFFGGIEGTERKALLIYPNKIENLINDNKVSFDEFIKVIRITLPNENIGQYEHRNYLGALIKLGIKREKIGDILVDKNGADIIISKEVEKFLISNLSELTRFQKAEIKTIKLNEIKKVEQEKETIKITVSSMRLDNIIAELAHCSRSKAEEILEDQRVFVNYENITKATKEIKQNDKITIRGKGRFEVKEITGNTKKGKIMIQVEH